MMLDQFTLMCLGTEKQLISLITKKKTTLLKRTNKKMAVFQTNPELTFFFNLNRKDLNKLSNRPVG